MKPSNTNPRHSSSAPAGTHRGLTRREFGVLAAAMPAVAAGMLASMPETSLAAARTQPIAGGTLAPVSPTATVTTVPVVPITTVPATTTVTAPAAPATSATVQTGGYYTVSVAKGYLALRTAMAYDASNELGALYTGDVVQLLAVGDDTYWYVSAPSLGQSGYVNRHYLVGGDGTYTVRVAKGYLALRTAKAYDESNEIGALYTGDTVQAQDTSDPTYWWVWAPSLGKSGYVNKNYLVGGTGTVDATMLVNVATGYLALRFAKAYDESNEIGALYTGDPVQVQDTSDPTYWWVYAPTLGRSGYVNRNYLVDANSSLVNTYQVNVQSGYLALRCAMAYDSRNELGALYNFDTVQVQERTSADYWLVYSPRLDMVGYVNCNYLIKL